MPFHFAHLGKKFCTIKKPNGEFSFHLCCECCQHAAHGPKAKCELPVSEMVWAPFMWIVLSTCGKEDVWVWNFLTFEWRRRWRCQISKLEQWKNVGLDSFGIRCVGQVEEYEEFKRTHSVWKLLCRYDPQGACQVEKVRCVAVQCSACYLFVL